MTHQSKKMTREKLKNEPKLILEVDLHFRKFIQASREEALNYANLVKHSDWKNSFSGAKMAKIAEKLIKNEKNRGTGSLCLNHALLNPIWRRTCP